MKFLINLRCEHGYPIFHTCRCIHGKIYSQNSGNEDGPRLSPKLYKGMILHHVKRSFDIDFNGYMIRPQLQKVWLLLYDISGGKEGCKGKKTDMKENFCTSETQ